VPLDYNKGIEKVREAMGLKATIQNFLETISISSREAYRNKINAFYKFLISEKAIVDTQFDSYLEGMDVEDIIESLNYYIFCNDINSQTMALHYASVIKRYFSFLFTLGIQNNTLIQAFGLPQDNERSYQYIMREIISNHPKLERRDQKEEITWEEAVVLIAECDQRIKEVMDENNVLDYRVYASKYNDLMSSIILKLILFTGIPYRILREINVDRVNTVHNTITINEFCIHIPNNLCEQLNYYLGIRRAIMEERFDTSPYLFVYADGKQLRKNTDAIATTLREYLGRSDLTGIIKFTIMQMIKKGINQSIIQNFNNVGAAIYHDCQQKVNQQRNTSISRYLDSKLRSMDVFDLL